MTVSKARATDFQGILPRLLFVLVEEKLTAAECIIRGFSESFISEIISRGKRYRFKSTLPLVGSDDQFPISDLETLPFYGSCTWIKNPVLCQEYKIQEQIRKFPPDNPQLPQKIQLCSPILDRYIQALFLPDFLPGRVWPPYLWCFQHLPGLGPPRF